MIKRARIILLALPRTYVRYRCRVNRVSSSTSLFPSPSFSTLSSYSPIATVASARVSNLTSPSPPVLTMTDTILCVSVATTMSSKMSKATVFIDDKDKPKNIPTKLEWIISQSLALRPHQETNININGVRIALNTNGRSDADDVSNIWVKFGDTIRVGEAKTQQFVARYLEEHKIVAVRVPRVYLAFKWGGLVFIVSEYIDGKMCDNSDAALVAPAVQALIEIPSPSLTPGPVGGGVIEHPFFIDRKSDIWYDTVEELEGHVNGVSVLSCLVLSFSPLGCFPAAFLMMTPLHTDPGRDGEARACQLR